MLGKTKTILSINRINFSTKIMRLIKGDQNKGTYLEVTEAEYEKLSDEAKEHTSIKSRNKETKTLILKGSSVVLNAMADGQKIGIEINESVGYQYQEVALPDIVHHYARAFTLPCLSGVESATGTYMTPFSAKSAGSVQRI